MPKVTLSCNSDTANSHHVRVRIYEYNYAVLFYGVKQVKNYSSNRSITTKSYCSVYCFCQRTVWTRLLLSCLYLYLGLQVLALVGKWSNTIILKSFSKHSHYASRGLSRWLKYKISGGGSLSISGPLTDPADISRRIVDEAPDLSVVKFLGPEWAESQIRQDPAYFDHWTK